ncbi:type III-A CRISPR-associated protein Cas10/Csm1 [Oscillochloris sp. ZM17-4]|uniref:type III-A CRISPR-associated protein Cas10/Csm1 n=1 Tax=Oscillochloris sp. ZM17-4 TaxID=2866714 RepID=UPI001C73C332|nr:type III-A CRISPR-associated protein Cas10/Csm1 [Oscillochloris sp. ZM17-4]MBX0330702.1 type III-A CRISPR-associated protein Cas10/Csm1 [Oscillochloris sp. ZM17-4]
MNQSPYADALAALRYWAAQASGASVDSPAEHVRHTAWLARGKPPEAGFPAPLKGQLESIFNRIKKEGVAPPQAYLRPAELRLTEKAIFPQAHPGADEDVQSPLRDALADLDRRDLPDAARLEGTLFALQRHAWALPSPLPAVSLYDFARTHAALAAALADNPGGEVCLVGGDVSGVQHFLYTLTADGATKQLRGRSLYLQLLTDACARMLLHAAGMPAANLIYSGGGRFYLLLPAMIKGRTTNDWLTAQRRWLDTFFFHTHQAELYLAVGSATLSQEDLTDPTLFQSAWGRATHAINDAKRRRFADLGPAFGDLFAPEGHNGNQDHVCAICGFQGEAQSFVRQDGEPPRCTLCDSFEDLGRLLHNAAHLVIHHLDLPEDLPSPARGRRSWQQQLRDLGSHIQLGGKHARSSDRENAAPAENVRYTSVFDLDNDAVKIPDEALLRQGFLPGPWVRGFRPMANTTPTMTDADKDDWKPQKEGEQTPRTGDVKPFGVMVAQSRGVKRLGVLRMDVDDLGDLFRYRLDSGLARVAALSASLSLFFEGWVGVLCDTMNDPQQRMVRGGPGLDARGSVYCIYSGGDDLFIVGSWHLLLPLAHWISADLADFTGGNPNVHLSGGISLHTAKFPLYQAAEAADEELKQAKAREGKAALGWIEQVTAWKYMPELFDLTRRLDDYLDRDQPRALLQTLQQLYVQYRAGIDPEQQRRQRRRRTGKPGFGPWMWHGAYQLKRVADSLRRKNPADADFVDGLHKKLLEGLEDQPVNEGGRAIERYGLAARWAQMLNRNEKE